MNKLNCLVNYLYYVYIGDENKVSPDIRGYYTSEWKCSYWPMMLSYVPIWHTIEISLFNRGKYIKKNKFEKFWTSQGLLAPYPSIAWTSTVQLSLANLTIFTTTLSRISSRISLPLIESRSRWFNLYSNLIPFQIDFETSTHTSHGTFNPSFIQIMEAFTINKTNIIQYFMIYTFYGYFLNVTLRHQHCGTYTISCSVALPILIVTNDFWINTRGNMTMTVSFLSF